MQITDENKKFNLSIFAGLAGGLLVLWSQIAVNEIKKLLSLPDSYIIDIFGTLIFSVLLFILFVIIIRLPPIRKRT